jgi:UDP-2,3-diacylglucosamine pyrophosphatase LpxH
MENVLISDIHLGSDVCQADDLCHLLKDIDPEVTRRLIIVGDIFDSIDLRRLKKHHWKVLSHIRRLADKIEIIWLAGNHDGPAEIVSHFLGVEVYAEYVLESGNKKFFITHGHKYDKFINERPFLTSVADFFYHWLQKLDRSHYIARMAKRNSKHYLRNTEVVRAEATEEAAQKGCEGAVCGHTHFAEITEVEIKGKKVIYCNTGCWTERPTTYLIIENGIPRLEVYEKKDAVQCGGDLGLQPARQESGSERQPYCSEHAEV